MNEPNEKWFKMVCKMMGELETRMKLQVGLMNDLNKRMDLQVGLINTRMDKQEETLKLISMERKSLKIILTKAAKRMEYIESFIERIVREMGGEIIEETNEDLSKDRILN
jgi:hypothetical protein